MRIFTILFFYILCINLLLGQTPVDQTVKKPASVKVHSLPRAIDFNTWDIGLSPGITYPYTDISASGKRDFGIALDVTKFLTHTFALQTRFLHASLSGVDENNPDYHFNTTIDYDISLNGILQFGNISYLKRNTNLAPFAFIGIGLIHYSPEVSINGGSVLTTGIYSQYSQPLVEKDYKSTTGLIIPIGFGMKYHLSKNYSITLEYSFRSTNSDKLDGFYKLLSSKDNYSFFSAGFTFHIGNNQKILEWVNPLQTVYDELYDLKDKFKQLSKDTDMDGVPDLYDREPNTAPGTKVYGDGTSVDIDGDGIPDSNDAEPFSERNAKVDVFGRTIDKPVKVINPEDTTAGKMINENKNDSGINNLSDVQIKRVEIDPGSKTTNTTTIIETGINLNADTIQLKPEKSGVAKVPAKVNTINSINATDSSQYKNNKDIPSVYFASGEFRITTGHFNILKSIAQIMMNNPELNFNIIGVSDNTGNMEFNLTLCKRRAVAVKRYLEDNFNINSVRLSVDSIPIYEQSGSNKSNRRVDIKVRN